MYHTDGILTKMGFSQIKYGNPQKGDIYVQDRTKTHEDGHIVIYNGTNWVSDFIQNSDNVYRNDPGTKYFIDIIINIYHNKKK